MNKVRLFMENFLVYGVGGVVSKIIPLIMVPIVATLMPNSAYFGINDMSTTIVSFGSALAIMGMYDAMYRMFFEKDDERFKKQVCSTAVFFTLITSIAVFLLMLVFKDSIAQVFFRDKGYAYLIYLSAMATLIGATNSIISAPTRMQNKKSLFLIINILSPILSYAISVPMLLAGYYVIALPLAGIISSIVIEAIFWAVNREWFKFCYFDKKLIRPLLSIAIPLLPNFLIYWVFNSSDKIMITQLIDIGAEGIYSVGAKLGHASQLIYTAFAGGWQYFAFATMKEDNQVKTNSMIFEYLGIISFAATTFICAWSHFIYDSLFPSEYIEGYIIAPYLFLAPLLLMLFQVIANQFLVIKKTWPNLPILSVGAILNVLLNLFLIPAWGIEGAAVATLLGYAVSVCICAIVLLKMRLLVISKEFVIATVVMIVFLATWRICFSENTILGTLSALIACLIFVLLYRTKVRCK